MNVLKLAEGAEHAWYVLGRDENKTDTVIDTNEYLIRCQEESMLLDPGGTEIFPDVVSAVARILPIEQIKHFLCSHQDPDIFSSLPLWMGLCPQANIYLSWIWSGFVAHYGHEYVSRFVKVPDIGQRIKVGSKEFHAKTRSSSRISRRTPRTWKPSTRVGCLPKKPATTGWPGCANSISPTYARSTGAMTSADSSIGSAD